MGKKKGSAILSEEERLVMDEEKRHRESEIQKQKEDMLTQYLKDKLNKEEKFSKLNQAKLNFAWRDIMRMAKAKELKMDCEVLTQLYERLVDRKDSQLKSTVKDLYEAEEQYLMARRSHIMNVDRLVDHHRRYLDLLREEFDHERLDLQDEFDEESEMATQQHEREINDLQDIVIAMEQRHEDKAEEALIEFNNMRDEIKNKNLEEKHSLRVQLEYTVDKLWNAFEEALDEYKRQTAEKKERFESNKAKDEKDAIEIAQNLRKLQRLQAQISRIRSVIDATISEGDWQNNQIRMEVNEMHSQFHVLKKDMIGVRTYEANRMKKLTVESNSSMKELKRKSEKGERMLRLMEMCRKLETEEEKVTPFYASSLTQEEEDRIEEAVNVEPPREKLTEIMKDYAPLEKFWKRYNKVLLDNIAMEKEKQMILEEGYQLRVMLKQYLDGISVNDEVINKTNPLFIVNYKSNAMGLNQARLSDKRVVRRPAPQTVMEAAHISAASHAIKK